MQLTKAISRFIRDRRTHCSKRTLEWYEYMLKPLMERMGGEMIETVTADNLRRLMNAQHARLSDNSRAMMTRAIKTFFRWCVRDSILQADPSAGLVPPKIQWHTNPLTLAQVKRLLDFVDAGDWPLWQRDRAIVYLLLDTALRAGELCSLRVRDMNLGEGYIDVVGKGNKKRRVGFRPTTAQCLKDYLQGRTSGHLFRGRNNQPLNAHSLWLMLRRLSKRCNVPIAPHRARHTSATLFIEFGGDAFLLQQLLGHEQISTTERYTKAAKARAALEAHKRFSPIEKLRGGK